jgi:hypothetical protein
VVAAARSIGARAQEPPETTGADADDGDAEGVWAGCCSPPLELDELEVALADCVAEDRLVVLWPWKDRAAARDTAPLATTAPAISQRLIRPIRANPASRALMALLLTPAMVLRGCKRTLNQP